MLAMDPRWLDLDLPLLSSGQRGAGTTSPFPRDVVIANGEEISGRATAEAVSALQVKLAEHLPAA
jgi:hypothetical protein